MAIIASHKEGIRYIEHCRVMVVDEKLVLSRRDGAYEKSYSIPYFNLAVLLLGQGTSVTQKAARFLSSEGVMLGFCGTGGTGLRYF